MYNVGQLINEKLNGGVTNISKTSSLIPIDDYRYENPRCTTYLFGDGSRLPGKLNFEPTASSRCQGACPRTCETKHYQESILLSRMTRHPYYPLNAPIPFYSPNETPLTHILAAFAAITGAVVLTVYSLACRSTTRPIDRFAAAWFALCKS